MSDSWQERKLGDVLTLEYGKPLPPSSRDANGKYIVYGANGIKDRSNQFYVDKPSIVVGRKGSAGEITLTQDKFWPLDVTYFVTFDDAKYDLRFLYYLLSLLELTKLARGVKPGINRNDVYAKTVRVPALSEQQRIVAILDEVFAGLATATANAEKNLRNARELFDSYLQREFDARQDQVRLSILATEITDGDHSPPPKASSGVPFITISNIMKETREIDFGDTFFVPKDYFQRLKPNKKPRVGDILYTVTGTLGIPVLIRDQMDFCFQRHIGLIRPGQDVDSSWLSYALASPYVLAQATIGSTGAAQKTVSLSVLRNIEVPKVNLLEQQRIGKKLESLAERTQRLAVTYRQKSGSLALLKQSILQKALSGELTSPSSQTIRKAAE